MAKELPKNSHRVSDVLLRAVRCVERSEVLLRMPGDGMLEAWGWDAGSLGMGCWKLKHSSVSWQFTACEQGWIRAVESTNKAWT